jgi:hypothetical protein
LSLSADDGGIDRQPFDVGIVGHRLEYPVDHALLDPAVIAPLGCLAGTKAFGKITPTAARARQPQQGIEKPPAVATRTTLALAASRYELAQPLPSIVPKNFSFHTSLQKPVLNQKSYTP